MHYYSLGIIFFFTTRAHAYSTFEITCTVPSQRNINFVSSPDARGTLDILWSCIFTILACTWTIQHLNLPAQQESTSLKGGPHGFWCNCKFGAKRFWSNLKWMVITILAPEYILGKAIGDFCGAWRMREDMRKYATSDGVEWTLTHGFFAMMGGFTVLAEGDSDSTRYNPSIREHQDMSDAGEATPTSQTRSLEDSQQSVRRSKPLTAKEILSLRTHRTIAKLPRITEPEIHDKSKSNIFVKVVAIGQVIWVSIQVIARVAKGLSVSPLEVVVTAFSACAILTYLFLIPKPQGVQIPCQPIIIPSWPHRSEYMPDGFYMRVLFMPGIGKPTGQLRDRIPNDYIDGDEEKEYVVYIVGVIFGGIIFGSIHIAGWNLQFHSATEQLLWRVASVLITCLLPVVFLPTILIFAGILGDSERLETTLAQLWGFVFGFLYIAARVFLLVEIFRSLLYLPSDSYISTWASNIPHVG